MSREKRTADAVVRHQNHFLFSNDYLNRVLPDSPHWATLLSRSQSTAEKLYTFYDSMQSELNRFNAEMLTTQWIRPLLEILGHSVIPIADMQTLEINSKSSDLALVAVNVEGGDLSDGDIQALVNVLPWDAPLDSLSSSDVSLSGLNPMAQMVSDLRQTGIEWGFLCNGRLLRLVSRQRSVGFDSYFQLDLSALLDCRSEDEICYLIAFFGTYAFEPVKKKKVFLDEVVQASLDNDANLMTTLQENLLQALEILIQGFLDFPGNMFSQTDLHLVYENAVYTLYRLTFVLFAESRGWLALDNQDYYEHYSLEKLRNDIASDQNEPSVRTTNVWDRLSGLFNLLGGKKLEINSALGIQPLDDTLFNNEVHPSLGEKKIGDAAFYAAIDLISRRKLRGNRKITFDYSGFRPRQVGERLAKLLDYKPCIAMETLARVDELSHQRWLPAADLSEEVVVLEQRDQGRAYLEDKRGFAKSPGQTPLPAILADYMAGESIATWLGDRVSQILEAIDMADSITGKSNLANEFVDLVLSLRLIDPACGSGQIVCYALDKLASVLCGLPYSQPSDSSLLELQSWKKTILRHCIYGIDKNPLSVALTRLCLWLETGFDTLPCVLDHHIKCGDSLIGARVQDLGWAPPQILKKDAPGDLAHRSAGQLNAFGFLLNQSLPQAIADAVSSEHIFQDENSDKVACKQAFEKMEEKLRPLRMLGDLWMSVNFGNAIRPGNYDEALQYISQPDKLAGLPAVILACQIAQNQSFFHWELAFPEVFFTEKGQPRNSSGGFDVILGYPAHGYAERQSETHEIQHEPFIFFWKTALKNAHTNTVIAFITPATWLEGKRHATLRQSVLNEGELLKILSLPGSALNYEHGECCLVWLRKGKVSSGYVSTARVERLDAINQLESEHYTNMEIAFWQRDPYTRFSLDPALVTLQGLVNSELCKPLGNITKMSWGLKPYSRGVQLEKDYSSDMLRIFEPPSPEERHIYFPELIEERLTRYAAYPSRKSWVKYTGMYAGAVKEEFFTQPRIMINYDLSPNGSLMAAATAERIITSENILNIIVTDDGYSENYLEALINSKLLSWVYHNQSSLDNMGDNLKVTIDAVKKLPIQCTDAHTQPFERSQQGSQMRREVEILMENIHSVRDLIGLDDEFAQLLKQVEDKLPDNIDIIHDLLSFLAEGISEQIDRRKDISRNFWRDLAVVAGSNLFEKLKQKQVRENTLSAHLACKPFVNASSIRERSLDNSLGWDEEAYLAFVITLAGSQSNLNELVGPYRVHSPAYRHRNVLVAAYDWLIDRIVYRLYGLGKAEMAIIDGITVKK